MHGLALFAKAPILGHAQALLGHVIGMQRAAESHQGPLLQQPTSLRDRLPQIDVRLYAASEMEQRWFERHAPNWPLAKQRRDDLGERLSAIFQERVETGGSPSCSSPATHRS